MVHVGDGADGCLEHSLETENLLFKQDGRTVLETMIWASRSWNHGKKVAVFAVQF